MVFLAEHEGEDTAVGVFAFGGVKAGDGGAAACGVDEPGEHFERGGLARAVGAEEAHELALGDVEGYVVGGGEFLEVAVEEAAHATPEAGAFFVGAEDAGEVFDFDQGGHGGEANRSGE